MGCTCDCRFLRFGPFGRMRLIRTALFRAEKETGREQEIGRVIEAAIQAIGGQSDPSRRGQIMDDLKRTGQAG